MEEIPFRRVSTYIFVPFNLAEYKDMGTAIIITFVDLVKRTVALSLLRNAKATEVLKAFQSSWLSRFPKLAILHPDKGA